LIAAMAADLFVLPQACLPQQIGTKVFLRALAAIPWIT
jgi:hypothetical protein